MSRGKRRYDISPQLGVWLVNRIVAFAFILAALAVQATASHAAILLDNTSITVPSNYAYARDNQSLGFVFTPSANYTLDSLTLAFVDPNGSTTVSLALWNVDSANTPTGTALATATETITVGGGANVVTLSLGSNATGSWNVTAGTAYGLTFAGSTLDTKGAYFNNNLGADPTTLNASYGSFIYGRPDNWTANNTLTPWMQLSGTPTAVPEPSTWALALAGVTCSTWGMARRRAAGRVREA